MSNDCGCFQIHLLTICILKFTEERAQVLGNYIDGIVGSFALGYFFAHYA